MVIIRNIALLSVCIALLIVNVASAAADCCIENTNKSATEIYIDNDIHKPCHEMVYDFEQDITKCDGCDCKHGIKISFLPNNTSVKKINITTIQPLLIQNIYSRQPEEVFQPPKTIS